MTRNIDEKTVGGFGREWSTFTQSGRELTDEQRARLFADYFAVFPWETLPAQGASFRLIDFLTFAGVDPSSRGQ